MSQGNPDQELDRLSEEFVARVRNGEDVSVEAYCEAHPELAERIEGLFPLLAAMEGGKLPTPSDAPKAPDPAPERIAAYEVVREIGRGGMGRVYQCRAPDGTSVALKLVHPHLVDAPGYLARFLREVDAGTRLDHPGVVRTLGSGVAEQKGLEVPYLVLEYVEGQNLRDLLDEVAPLSERLCLLIGARVADGLQAIHDAGMVHRDVKPENVLLTPDEHVKLMDLGIALLREEAMRLSQTGEFVGSLLYAAPEQIRGETPDERSDLYGLGLLLFELVTGKHPAQDTGSHSALPVRRLDEAPSAQERNPGISSFLNTVIRTLLQHAPGDRFESAEEVAVILREGESGDWWQARAQPAPRAQERSYERMTALRGRDLELATLDTAFSRVRLGEGRVIVVEGDAGIGKSRLVHEWLDQVESRAAEKIHISIAGHAPGGEALVATPLASALAACLDPEDLEGDLERHLGAASSLSAPLGELLRGEAMTPRAGIELASLGSACHLLLRGLAQEAPTIVVVEDLHFASDEARGLFLELSRATRNERALLIGTTRPERSVWSKDFDHVPHATHLTLTGLPSHASHEMLRDALEDDVASRDRDLSEVARNAEGNPFYLLEFARELRAARARDPRASYEDVAIPDSLKRLMEGRLGAVSTGGRDLLSVAACCGDRFDPTLVCEAAELGKLQGLRLLHELDRRHDLLRPIGDLYRFQHHLVQEVLYDDLPPALREAYHGALGRALEARQGEGATVDGASAFERARHFLLSDDPKRALPYATAGLRYLYDLEEMRRMIRLADHLLELGDVLTREARTNALMMKGRALIVAAGPKAALPVTEEAYALGKDMDDPDVGLAVRMSLSLCLRHEGQTDAALEVLEETVTYVQAHHSTSREGRALGALSLALYAKGRFDEAAETAQRALELVRQTGHIRDEAEVTVNLATVELERGNMEESRILLDHAVHVAAATGNYAIESNALSIWSKLAYMEGRTDEAQSVQRRLLNMARERGSTRMESVALVNLTQALADEALFEEALDQGRAAYVFGERLNYTDALIHVHLAIGGVHRAMGDFQRAHDEFARGHEMAIEIANPAVIGRMARSLGNVLGWMGAFEEAETIIRHSLELVRGGSVAIEAGQLEAALGDVLAARGDDEAMSSVLSREREEALKHGFRRVVLSLDVRLGEAALRLGDAALARQALERAIQGAEACESENIRATCVALLGAVPGGDATTAAVTLKEMGRRMSAHTRMLAYYALGSSTGDDALLERAADELDTLIRRAPERYKESMRGDVPFHAAVLAAAGR